jgi:acyl-coenzyme A synthetase/AMP-(fatty) acid ligase
VLAITSPSFDPSVLDLMLPLVVRAKVVIASARQVRDTQAVRALLEQHQVSLLQATPSVWRALIDSGWMGGRGFRALIGGEPLPPVLAERLLERTLELWNIYGPTETTVWTTAWKVESPRKGIAIGRPIANTSVWVLDSHGHVCPIGVPGELYVGGAGVGLGYHHRDDLTAKHFVRDPFNSGPESLLYRTGDLGRWRHDGLLEHLGRADHQVKLRGHRIELGEIESVLLDHPGVSNCVALTRALSEEDVRLVMYFVGHEGAVPTAETLRSHLRERLPLHMIPQHFVALEAMPRLPNGKIDRSALPAPVLEPQTRKAAVLIAPETPNERMIAGIWSELLGAQDIYCADNFFDLGGHSLLAMRAVKAIRDASGLKIEPTRLIYESLRQLAATEDGG